MYEDTITLLAYFERQNNRVKLDELQTLGMTKGEINQLVYKQLVQLEGTEVYGLTSRFYDVFQEKYRKDIASGILRRDLQFYIPQPKMLFAEVEHHLTAMLEKNCAENNLLVKTINFRPAKLGVLYDIEFYPGLYSRGYNQVVFPWVTKGHEKLTWLVHNVSGMGEWELAAFYKKLAASPPTNYTEAVTTVLRVVEERYHPGRPYKFSETQDRIGLISHGRRHLPRTRVPDVYFDFQNKTYVLGESYNSGMSRLQFKKGMQKIVDELRFDSRRFASITFKELLPKATPKILPTVGLAFSADKVWSAPIDSRLDAGVNEAYLLAGGTGGSLLGAARGMKSGPRGAIVGGLLGGMIGTEAGFLSNWAVKTNPVIFDAVLRAAGGTLEVTAGAACMGLTQGAGAAFGCGAIFVHGLDNLYTAGRELGRGRSFPTLTQQALTPMTGPTIAAGIDATMSLVSAGIGAAPQVAIKTIRKIPEWGMRLTVEGTTILAKANQTVTEWRAVLKALPAKARDTLLTSLDRARKATVAQSKRTMENPDQKFVADVLRLNAQPNAAQVPGALIRREVGQLSSNKITVLRNHPYTPSHALIASSLVASPPTIGMLSASTSAREEKNSASPSTAGKRKSVKPVAAVKTREQLDNEASLLRSIESLRQDVRDILDGKITKDTSKQFETNMQRLNYGLRLASIGGTLSGNQGIQQIAMAGSALMEGASIVAGLNGIGFMAGIDPVTAGLGILCVVGTMVGVFGKKKKDNNQALVALHQAMVEMVRALGERMDARFDQVVEMIGELGREFVRRSAETKNDIDLLHREMNQLYVSFFTFKKDNQFAQATIVTYLKRIAQSQHARVLKDKYDEFFRKIEEAENYIIREKEDLRPFSDMMNGIYTLLQGSTGCKSSDVTGQEVTRALPSSQPNEFAELLAAYQNPMMAVRTLVSYQNDLKQPTDYYYTPEEIEVLLNSLLASIDRPFAAPSSIGKMHMLSSLVQVPKAQLPFMHHSLAKTINQFIEEMEEVTINRRLFIPMLINARYGLLLVESKPQRFYYFGATSHLERVQKIISTLTQVSSDEEEAFDPEYDFCDLDRLPPNYSALTLLSLVEVLLYSQQVENVIAILAGEPIEETEENKAIAAKLFPRVATNNERPAVASSWPSTQADYQQQHVIWQERLLTLTPHTNAHHPVSPMLWQVMMHRYLQLFKTKLMNSAAEASYANAAEADIRQLQAILDDAEMTRQLMQRARNKALVAHVVREYSNATTSLQSALTSHLADFETRLSTKYNAETIKRLEALRVKSLQQLAKQEVEIKGDYSCVYNFTANVAVNDWGRNRTNVSIQLRKWFTGYSEGHLDWVPPGVGYGGHNEQLKAKYIKTQSDYMKALVAKHEETHSSISHAMNIHLFARSEVQKVTLSPVVWPQQENSPILPSRQVFATFIPDPAFFEAQGLQLGQLDYSHDLQDKDFKLASIFKFDTTEAPIVASMRKKPYTPLFYVGGEAIWRYALTTQCSTDPNCLANNPMLNYGAYNHHCYVPALSTRTGMFDNTPETMEETVDYTSSTYQADKTRLMQRIEEKKITLRAEWQSELVHVFKNDTESELGAAVAKYDAAYALLIAFLEMTLPYDQHQLLVRNLTQVLAKNNDSQQFAGNKASLINLLKNTLTTPLMEFLPTSTQIERATQMVESVFRLHEARTENVFFDQAEASLLAVLDQYAPTVKRDRAVFVKVTRDTVHTMMNMLEAWRSVDPNDARAVVAMQQQMGNVFAMMNACLIDPASVGQQRVLSNARTETMFGASAQSTSSTSSSSQQATATPRPGNSKGKEKA